VARSVTDRSIDRSIDAKCSTFLTINVMIKIGDQLMIFRSSAAQPGSVLIGSLTALMFFAQSPVFCA
jgi:hypothetical protein